jgi:tRNA (cmo5U34)-methyltransferase
VKRDDLFRHRETCLGDFAFDAQVTEVFDDMVRRSVPLYNEQQQLVQHLGEAFWIPGTSVYDLGCSTGTTLVNLCRRIGTGGRFVGYDNSSHMINLARIKMRQQGLETHVEIREGDLNGPLSDLPLDNASVVTVCWVLQFIQPEKREALVRWIHNSLINGGALIVTEKIKPDDAQFEHLFADQYQAYKMRNDYSREEILRKDLSLKNVLVPYSLRKNLDLFQRGGFEVVTTIFQWLQFAGFLCVKGAVIPASVRLCDPPCRI